MSVRNASEPVRRGTVHFIGAGPGDPDLITVKGRSLIERCGYCLFAGSLVPREVVAFAPRDAVVRNTASMNLEQIIGLIDEATANGHDVARVHSGDPSLYGAVAEQIRRLDAIGIPTQIVPGVSSYAATAAALKIELTPAARNQTVILTRASGITGVPANEDLAELARHRVGMAIFLAGAQVPELVAALAPHYGPKAEVVVAHRVSWPDERIVRTSLDQVERLIDAEGLTRTTLFLIGPMLEPGGIGESHLYDPAFSHLFRKGVNVPLAP